MKKVGPNLYRAPSGRYYLLVKRAGKQFRRSLKTKDFTLAKRRLREFQDKAGKLGEAALSLVRSSRLSFMAFPKIPSILLSTSCPSVLE
jgi:hypothetical protein